VEGLRPEWVAVIVASLSLVWSLINSVISHRRQKHQDLLNRRLLARFDQEESEAARGDVSARLYRAGHNKWRLKIWNQGKGTAKNVRFEAISDDLPVIQSDVDAKFPMRSMERQQSVELIAAVHMQSPRKNEIKLLWEDESGEARSKTVELTL